MNLRPYQSDAITNIRAAFARGRRAPLLVAPTGAGKTQIFSFIAHAASAKGSRVVIVVHRAELAKQAAKTLDAWGVKHGPVELVSVGMVGALANKAASMTAPDLMVFDEAHHAVSATYAKLRAAWPSARILGVSATPSRLDGKPLGGVFDELISGPTVAWLTANGFLCPAKYFAPPNSLDLSQVKRTAGDFNRGQLDEAVNKPAITGDIVAHYQRLCHGAQTIVFCVSVAHAKAVAEAFNTAGVSASGIDGGMSEAEREDINARFASGELRVLTSCELIAEGYDLPACAAVVLARPTDSLSMHLQSIGRCLRIAPGKTHAWVLDCVGNLARHGLAEDERSWSLDGKQAATRQGPPPESATTCPKCYAVFKPAKVCPCCGHTPPTKSRRLDQVDGDLVPFFTNLAGETLHECVRCGDLRPDNDKPCACGHDPAEEAKREARREVGKARTLPELHAIAKARGYAPGWVHKRWGLIQARR